MPSPLLIVFHWEEKTQTAGEKKKERPQTIPKGQRAVPLALVLCWQESGEEGTGMTINSAPQWSPSSRVYERERDKRGDRGFVTRKGKNDGGNEGRNFKKGKNELIARTHKLPGQTGGLIRSRATFICELHRQQARTAHSLCTASFLSKVHAPFQSTVLFLPLSFSQLDQSPAVLSAFFFSFYH